MTRPIMRYHNSDTGETTDREMTDEELKTYEEMNALDAAQQAEADAKETAKAALLKKLGITADEARLLLA